VGIEEALGRALEKEERHFEQIRWSAVFPAAASGQLRIPLNPQERPIAMPLRIDNLGAKTANYATMSDNTAAGCEDGDRSGECGFWRVNR
jgi:hypothetical protein